METEVLLSLIGSGVTALGVATGFIVNIVKSRREIKILKAQEAAEQKARLKAEKQKFYLTTAANLVLSAEKLALTGPQKKEYVMTWLENEAVKAGIQVDPALMSVAIERTILILNDFKGTDAKVTDLLAIELDQAVEAEKIRIGSEANRALGNLDREINTVLSKTKEGVAMAQTTLKNVKTILDKKK